MYAIIAFGECVFNRIAGKDQWITGLKFKENRRNFCVIDAGV
jgi:hypothetical protein